MHRRRIRAAMNHKNNSSEPRSNVCGYSFHKAFFLCGLAVHPHADRFYVTKDVFWLV